METATQTLHRLTSYEPGRDWDVPHPDPRVVRSFESNDLRLLPWFFKRFEGSLPRVALPRELPPSAVSALATLAGTSDVPRVGLDLPQLSRLLYLSAGVVRTMKRPYGSHPFRAAGSAGGRFPLELYLAVPEEGDLPPGVHWYDPSEHSLVRIGPPPRGEVPALVVAGVPWRTGWRYRERGFRHVYWDAGTMLAQTLAAADSAGIDVALYTRFSDERVAELVGADRVHEWPVAVLSLGVGDPALEATGPAVRGRVDDDPLEFPLVTSAQRAGELDSLGAGWSRGDPVDLSTDAGGPVETVVLTRGSQRRMDPTRGVAGDVLRTSLTVALRDIDVPHWAVVHDVDGFEPGVYRWPELASPQRAGNLRDELYRVCLDQGLARDAAFVVIGATVVTELDDRGYREAQLAAGLVEGRLHLAAYALGASATGMTFLDSEIPDLLGQQVDALLFTCVGVARYRSRSGGRPGTPTEVRRVTPGD